MTLLNKDIDGTKVFVEVYISPETGNLVMAGQDLGLAPQASFGRDEYEYFLSVPAAEKDRMLLHLMVAVFGGIEETRTSIGRWCDERAIPYSLHSF